MAESEKPLVDGENIRTIMQTKKFSEGLESKPLKDLVWHAAVLESCLEPMAAGVHSPRDMRLYFTVETLLGRVYDEIDRREKLYEGGRK